MLAGIHVQVTISDSSLSCRQGVIDSSIPKWMGSRDFLGIPPVSCRDTDWSMASDYKCL